MSRELAQAPFLRSLRRLRVAFWRRRVAHWLVRTLWLALLVPAVSLAGLAGAVAVLGLPHAGNCAAVDRVGHAPH